MLTILETASQVQWYVENQQQQSKVGSVLAVTPIAAYACQESSQAYLKLEEHSRYSHRFAEYPTILQEYLNWEAWLDDWAQQAVPEFKNSGFQPARAVTFLLQLLVTEIWATATNLREFLQTIKPTKIACWPPRITDVPRYLQPGISPATVLLPNIAEAQGIEVINLSKQVPELTPSSKIQSSPSSLPARFKSWAKSYLRQSSLFMEVEMLQKLGPKFTLGQLNKDHPNVLISGYGYDLESLILELRRKGCHVSRLKDNSSDMDSKRVRASLPKTLSQRLTQAGSQLLQEPDLWKPLERWGIDRTPLLARPLDYWWQSLVPVLWLRYQHVNRLLKRKKYAAIVTMDCGASTWGGPDCQAAQTYGVPRFVHQHGGSTGCGDAKIWQMYLRGGDSLLVAGEGTIQELEQSRPPYLHPYARFTPVGSSRLDKLRRQHSLEKSRTLQVALKGGDQRPIILYIPTTFGTYGRAVSDLAAYPEVSYLELQQSILRLFAEVPEVRLLYKDLIVANDPNRVMPDFIPKCIPNATVTYQRLTDLMWSVDAIIVDHTITALSEVLLTNKRLVVYMPKPSASSPQAKTLLRKRATVAETPSEFMSCVRAFLSAGDFSELEETNDEFLRMYCTHANDGRSAERAASVILEHTSEAQAPLGHEIVS